MSRRAAKRWEIKPIPVTKREELRKSLGISSITAQVLLNRGIHSPDQAKRFLYPTLSDLPDPFSMKGMDAAVARIAKALRERERIALFGDYDVDGTTATALLFLFLKKAGSPVEFFLPHRVKEGYGLNLEALEKIRSSGARLIITVDCGISNPEEVRWAADRGLEVIITDHHEIPEKLPPALAILNPKREGCPYPFKGLAGVGVAFNLIIALRSHLRREGFFEDGEGPNLKEYLDLVALGTVSDVVPLAGVNRILVKYGLSELSQSGRPGILALREVSGIADSPVDTAAINFRLAPRLNAAGRLEDAREAVELLIAGEMSRARQIASHLQELNSLRQRIEEKIFAEAKEKIDSWGSERAKKSIVLASLDWHPGIIGIVASRLTEEFHCPTILIALQEDLGKGSGRSIDSFPLYEGLKACQHWMEKFGGHEQAAGLVIRADHITPFAEAFEKVVRARLTEEDFVPRVPIDALASLGEMDEPFLSELETLSPFGTGNPEPILGLENLTILESKLVGRGHLRLKIKEGRRVREAIGFGMAGWHPVSGEGMKMAATPQIGNFQGNRVLQLKIVDLQPMG